jgi:IS30 family transposase
MKRYNHLTKEQRYTISVCLRKKMSLSAIAKLIDVSKSTVSREIKKNSNMYRHYVAIDVPQVIDRMVKEYGIAADNAMKELYTSQLYADLERESSELWHLSPLALAELWHCEKTTGHIPYPEEA